MNIDANTKIATLIKGHPDALETIISLSPKFTKLRNPLLRRIMASRTSIATACKISGLTINDFFTKLKPLGFEIDSTITAENTKALEVPEFMKSLPRDQLETLDVRPIIEGGKDPFNTIIRQVKQLPETKTLKLINSFEPAPLISILGKQGFDSFVEYEGDNVVNTYFKRKNTNQELNIPSPNKNSEGWDQTIERYRNNLFEIDVRHLEMPMPMMTILENLEKLPDGKALFVHHKRIPVFLLPELKDRNFEYLIKEINEGEVNMLIFKK